MSQQDYQRPEVWEWKPGNGGRFANINRPTAGPRFDQTLPVGKHPLQLYSQGTPNGQKVTILLEELLALGIKEAEYNAFLIEIMESGQFGSDFVKINPNSKIPALMDHSTQPPTRVFESGHILLYLAERFQQFIPSDAAGRTECLNWLFWQMASAPILGGGFGHFFAYAPKSFEYPINRYTMEVKRQLDVLDRELAQKSYIAGDDYTIADIAIFPWYGSLVRNETYPGAAIFLQAHEYENVVQWAEKIAQRPAVIRGRMVNKTSGDPAQQLRERHDASDFDTVGKS